MNEDEKKEFEEFLKWKKEKGNLTDNNLSKNDMGIIARFSISSYEALLLHYHKPSLPYPHH